MSNTICDGWNFQLTVYLITTLFCIAPYQLVGLPPLPFYVENYILITLLTGFSVLHFHYGYGIVTEMCEHFGIKCFTVCLSFYHSLTQLSLNCCFSPRFLFQIKPKQRGKNVDEAMSIQIES